jgi:hypothetical protein
MQISGTGLSVRSLRRRRISVSFRALEESVLLRRGVNTFGAVLIFFSAFCFLRAVEGAYAYSKEWLRFSPMLLVELADTVWGAHVHGNPCLLIGIAFVGTPIVAGLSVMSMSLGFLLGGIGLLSRKAWARPLFLVLGVDVLAGICLSAWLFGAQHLGVFGYGSQFAWAAVLLFLSADRHARNAFFSGVKSISRPAKWLIGIYLVVVVLKLLSAPLFIGYMRLGQRELASGLRAIPQKVAYETGDSRGLDSGCTTRRLFDYRISLPEDLRVLTVLRGSESSSWNVMFGRCSGTRYQVVANLSNGSTLGVVAHTLLKVYGLRSPYELERRIDYPGWSPIWMGWRLIHLPIDASYIVEEVTATHWKGFVVGPSIDSGPEGRLNCSAYDTSGESSAGVCLFLDGKDMTTKRAKDMLATLEFDQDPMDASECFSQGKIALANHRHTDATISFMNALYRRKEDPEYAYYLGRSLCEGKCEAFEKGSLLSSADFLKYALELDSTCSSARQLLAAVEKEIGRLEVNESK